jgi:integrase
MAEWVKKYNTWVAKEPVRPGIFRRQAGGYYLHRKVTDPATGRRHEFTLSMPDADLPQAEARMREETERLKEGGADRPNPSKTRFAAYAASLFERKVATGELKSSQSLEKWKKALGRHLVPAFGELFLPRLKATHVETWKAHVLTSPRLPTERQRLRWQAEDARAKANGEPPPKRAALPPPEPTSVNTWLAILRVIMTTAANEFEWPRDPLASVKPVDTSDHRTYTEEEPNSLTPEEARRFLAKMAELFPQHFAMTLLGFATGMRPSQMRPLRRKGATPDVLWVQHVLLVRRSQTDGEAMNKTKTARDQKLHLPLELMQVLHWHAERLPSGPQTESDLLFPSETGGYRSRSCLDKPFAAVAKAIGLKKRITPRGMRRTYQDLMRAANVEGVVVRAISGHATTRMQEHYSTVSPTEMSGALLRLANSVGASDALALVAASEGPHLRGARLPEAERQRRFTPRRFRPAVVEQAAPGQAPVEHLVEQAGEGADEASESQPKVAVLLWAQQDLNLRLRPCEHRTPARQRPDETTS